MVYRVVLVGADGSESSLRAVRRAAEVACSADSQADLVVVCAYHPMTAREQAGLTAGLGDTKFRVTGTGAAREALDAAVAAAREAGAGRAEGELVEDDAVEALLSIAEERSGDLIVVGNRGINRLSRRLLGSVASDVSQRAACDVLIVHTVPGGADAAP